MAPAQHTRLLLIALVAWPFLTGTPAFVVALCVSATLARFFRRNQVRVDDNVSLRDY